MLCGCSMYSVSILGDTDLIWPCSLWPGDETASGQLVTLIALRAVVLIGVVIGLFLCDDQCEGVVMAIVVAALDRGSDRLRSQLLLRGRAGLLVGLLEYGATEVVIDGSRVLVVSQAFHTTGLGRLTAAKSLVLRSAAGGHEMGLGAAVATLGVSRPGKHLLKLLVSVRDVVVAILGHRVATTGALEDRCGSDAPRAASLGELSL